MTMLQIRAMAKIRRRWADQYVQYALGQHHDTTVLFVYGAELGRWYTERDAKRAARIELESWLCSTTK